MRVTAGQTILRVRLKVVVAAVGVLSAHTTHAQLEEERNFGPGLIGLPYANQVERLAAIANDEIFKFLDEECDPFGSLSQDPSPTYSSIQPPPGSQSLCTEDAFFVYLNARELFHTANELRGQGPTVASLGLDQEGLGTALRWTAAEEFAAQASMATEFANSQLSNLAARISALRYGLGGFSVAGVYDRGSQNDRPALAGGRRARGGAAQGQSYSRWGGFLNLGYGYGSKEPTPLEDAFDFDGAEYTLGVDYRLTSSIVLGVVYNDSRQALDFDEAASAISVVDGGIDADATSFSFFAMAQGERLNINGSIGTQSIDYDVTREIEYPSFNPNLPSVSSTAQSRPKADVFTATFGIAWALTKNKFTFEPEFRAEYSDVDIGAFSESRSINRIRNPTAETRRFDLAVSSQAVESFDMVLGLRFQYVVTPRFGVLIPYWSLEAHREQRDEVRTITAGYAALSGIPGFNNFRIPTDRPDTQFRAFSAGVSTVFRGARQRTDGGAVGGGLMGFLQFKSIEDLRYFDDRVITGGLRYEF